MVIALALALTGSAALAASPAWSNPEWNYRAQVTAQALDEKANALVEWDVDFTDLLARAGAKGAFDPNSPRVMLVQAGQEKEIPSRFFPDKEGSAVGRLAWLRLGTMQAGAIDTYSVYFDEGTAKQAKSYPEMAHAKPVLGKNLIANANLTVADKDDATKPAGWIYDAGQPAGTIEWVRKSDAEGTPALKIVNTVGAATTVKASQQTAVEAGKRYSLSGWVRTEKDAQDGYAVLTGWLYTADSKAVTGPDGAYGNYKLQVGLAGKGECPWRYICNAAFGIFDPKTKTNHVVEDGKLLPGTGLMSIELDYTYGKGTAYFAGLELREMPSGLPMGIRVAAVEKKP